MRGENFRPAWSNERIKKWNAEHGDKPRKPIMFLPPPSMELTTTTSVPQDNSAFLSNLESRVSNLKSGLELEAKDVTRDEGDLDLQHFLAEIKDEDKEDLSTEQIDECSMDGTGHMMHSYRHN